MQKLLLAAAFSILMGAFVQSSASQRPKILGIDHVDFYTTAPDANNHLYTVVLGLESAPPLEPGQIQRFIVGTQWVGYSPAPDPKATDRMDHVALRTNDCEGMRRYLASKGIKVPNSVGKLKDGSPSFTVKDPEGHQIEFVQPRGQITVEVRSTLTMSSGDKISSPDPVSRRLIHTGFLVHDRAAEDHFYKDILGFHLYWYGGMQPGHTDWVAMQVPDGTDWLEYMLNIKLNPDLRLMGVVNHISLGVKDMKEAQAKLESHGWRPHGDEHAQMGKDGKWQLNVFDPDLTRIELMNFRPSEKPCCSEFQGPHPTEE